MFAVYATKFNFRFFKVYNWDTEMHASHHKHLIGLKLPQLPCYENVS